jgi:hypothetical protein
MISFHAFMAVFSITLGALWLRRAYLGVKAPLIVTLGNPTGERESRRARLRHASMGIANIAIGATYLMLILWKTGYLH